MKNWIEARIRARTSKNEYLAISLSFIIDCWYNIGHWVCVCEWKSHDKPNWSSIGWLLNIVIIVNLIFQNDSKLRTIDLVASSFWNFVFSLLSNLNRIHFVPYLCALHVLIVSKATVKIKTACVLCAIVY